VPPLLGAGAPQAVLPLDRRLGTLLPEVRRDWTHGRAVREQAALSDLHRKESPVDHRSGAPLRVRLSPLRWSVKAYPGGRRSLHLAPEGGLVEGQRGKEVLRRLEGICPLRGLRLPPRCIPGRECVGRGPVTGRGNAPDGCPSGRLWGVDISSSNMECEEERVNRKRKGQDESNELGECSVVLTLLPLPQKKGEIVKRRKCREKAVDPGRGVTTYGCSVLGSLHPTLAGRGPPPLGDS